MIVKPIPIFLLTHSIGYEELIGQGRYQPEYKSKIKISNVRVNVKSYIVEGAQYSKKNEYNVYVDRVFTHPFINFKKDSKVTINVMGEEKTLKIKEINVYHDFNEEPHHLLLRLG